MNDHREFATGTLPAELGDVADVGDLGDVHEQSGLLEVRDRPRVRRSLWVRKLEPQLEHSWDRFVAFHPDATLFHELAWMRTVQRSYGQTPHYLVAGWNTSGLRRRHPIVDGLSEAAYGQWGPERVSGVLPLFEVNGPFTGRALISAPYGVYGGVLAQDGESELALVRAAKGLADQLGARYVELRQREPLIADGTIVPGLQPVDRYVTFRKDLPAEVDSVLPMLPRKARAAARQGRDRHQLLATFGHDQLADFYRLYVRSLRRLGSPPYSRRFLRAILESFGSRVQVMLVRRRREPTGRPLAGVVAIRFRDELFAYLSGADERCAALQINNFMYLTLMEKAVGEGIRVFDFGRTRKENRGPYAFKCNQGFEPRPLPYQLLLREGETPPNVTPGNKAFSWPRKLWRRLPAPLVRSLGGLLTRWIP